jgi:hypothetical protein
MAQGWCCAGGCSWHERCCRHRTSRRGRRTLAQRVAARPGPWSPGRRGRRWRRCAAGRWSPTRANPTEGGFAVGAQGVAVPTAPAGRARARPPGATGRAPAPASLGRARGAWPGQGPDPPYQVTRLSGCRGRPARPTMPGVFRAWATTPIAADGRFSPTGFYAAGPAARPPPRRHTSLKRPGRRHRTRVVRPQRLPCAIR